jgi:outer membrane protein assembly factor BamE (lipoprotein component of BamABCDE complex)
MSGVVRKAVAFGVLGTLFGTLAACSLFSSSKQSEPVTQPTPAPATQAQAGQVASTQAAPPPTASLRERGAQIADEAMLKALVQGQTSKADVREIFGVPQEIVLSPGIETYLYIREKSVGWISKACERTEMLTVRFDPNGVLKEYEYRFAGK